MSKKKITNEQVQAALDVLKDWVAEDVDSRCCVTFAGDIAAEKGFAHVCGSENGVRSAILYGMISDEDIRSAMLKALGMIIGRGLNSLKDQMDGCTFTNGGQKGGQA